MSIILTIGIPVFNGEMTIRETLDSILNQLHPSVEVVVSDNASTDNTYEIIREYCSSHKQIKYFKNSSNLGFDENIDLIIKRSNGKFVWLMGDDDDIAPDGINKVIEVIARYSALVAIFVNYGLHERLTKKCVEERVLKIKEDVFCNCADEFLKTTTIYANFMSSIVVKRSRWLEFDSSIYKGTYWIQYGMLMKVIENKTAYCIAKPYVMNRGIEYNGPNEANRNGAAIQVLINLMSIIDNLPKSIFSESSIKNTRLNAYKLLPRKIFSSKRDGLILNYFFIWKIISIFGVYFTFWVRDFPILILPRTFHISIWHIYKSRLMGYLRNKNI